MREFSFCCEISEHLDDAVVVEGIHRWWPKVSDGDAMVMPRSGSNRCMVVPLTVVIVIDSGAVVVVIDGDAVVVVIDDGAVVVVIDGGAVVVVIDGGAVVVVIGSGAVVDWW